MTKIKYWLPAIAWMAVIFYFSGRTGSEIKSMFPFLPDLDWGHLAEYFVLSLLIYYGLVNSTRRRRPYLLAILLSTVYGVTDEWHQYYVPGRMTDIFDLVNDAAGAALAMVALHLYRMKKTPGNRRGDGNSTGN
jgi:VanZ family protein